MPSQREARPWPERYGTRLLISDLVVLVWVVFGTQIVWFGTGNAQLALRDAHLPEISYWTTSVVLVAVWLWALSLADSRSYRVIGVGNTEYTRVASSSVRVFGIIAITAFLFQLDIARGYLLISLPLGIVMLLLVRWLWRQWLIAMRARGQYTTRVLLVGSPASVLQVASELERQRSAGYEVVGACLVSPDRDGVVAAAGIPLCSSPDNIRQALAESGADTVAVTSSDGLPPERVKQISWSLESGKQHLVLAPSLADVAGPRIHMRPVAGLPLIQVETPRFSLGQRFGKRITDLLVAGVGVIAISPLLLILALLVKLTSRGPVLFRQTRIGYRGHEFTMLKFRSMVVDAEERLAELEEQRNTGAIDLDSGNSVMFKMKNDPRVTRVGRFMRKFSLDELPQLFNVVGGSMSLVGPRPPLPREVEQYADHVHRRFLVKPGITGLWQVSGRSSLSWEETVRLDLSYVENWSLASDVMILLKTGKAILAPGDTAH